jgi:hypothetical protein
MQVSLRTSAYGGVRAVMIVPREMITDEIATAYAHGIGAAGAPKPELGAIEGPKRKEKRRRPTSPKIPASVSMEDDVPVVTEWTAQGLPQRRRRVQIPLSERLAQQAAFERAEAAAREAGQPTVWSREPEPEPEEKDEPAPGQWVEAFWNGLKRDQDPTAPTQPTNEPAHAPADDEGDLK